MTAPKTRLGSSARARFAKGVGRKTGGFARSLSKVSNGLSDYPSASLISRWLERFDLLDDHLKGFKDKSDAKCEALTFADYIWLGMKDGAPCICSKTRVVSLTSGQPSASDFPAWTSDTKIDKGPETGAEAGGCCPVAGPARLYPIKAITDPFRGQGCFLVLCEVYDDDGLPVPFNERALLRQLMAFGLETADPSLSLSQPFTLSHRTFGSANDRAKSAGSFNSYPQPARFRDIVDEFIALCVEAGLSIAAFETNDGSLWSFDIAPRDFDDQPVNALDICDHLWLARFILGRMADQQGLSLSFGPCAPALKPQSADIRSPSAMAITSQRTATAGLYGQIAEMAAHRFNLELPLYPNLRQLQEGLYNAAC